jgi:hypothetical protein
MLVHVSGGTSVALALAKNYSLCCCRAPEMFMEAGKSIGLQMDWAASGPRHVWTIWHARSICIT